MGGETASIKYADDCTINIVVPVFIKNSDAAAELVNSF